MKMLDPFGVGIRLQKIAKFNVENLGDLALGKLPAVRHFNARQVWEHAVAGGSGFHNR
jgi:hypothetical protein